MYNHREAKIRRHAVGNVGPVLAVVDRAIQTKMILQEEPFRTRRMHHDLMHALTEIGILAGHEHYADSVILRCPPSAAIVGTINTTGRNRHVHTPTFRGIQHYRMQCEPAVARHPARPVRMIEQATHEGPTLS